MKSIANSKIACRKILENGVELVIDWSFKNNASKEMLSNIRINGEVVGFYGRKIKDENKVRVMKVIGTNENTGYKMYKEFKGADLDSLLNRAFGI